MISIIIVHYRVKKQLFECIKSILASESKTAYEIIVVDNDEKPKIGKEIKKKFTKVRYISGQGNVGFGAANNIGAKYAKGDLLFFLNPDTIVYADSLYRLAYFLNKNKDFAVVAPLLHNLQGKPYQQGSLELTPIRALASLSFFHKLFPSNTIAKKYYLSDWDKKSIREVDVVPGTAFMVRKEVFKKVGGFDKNFFLYFEEFDLCKRIKKLGWKLAIYPQAKVLHYWGSSTKHLSSINEIFKKSRFYYFRKHFGLFLSLLTEVVLRMGKYTFFLLGITILGLFLRLHNIYETMPFIGDQGWFYISARDMFLTNRIPLVGIESSHPWLHQGALWTYILAVWFAFFGFNPINTAYLTVIIDTFALLLMYKFGSLMFSRKMGIIAAILYATSPLIITNARMPYHTSPIPLFTIVYLYFLYKWIQGNKYYFPLVIMSLAILYNLELATFLLSFITAAIFIYGIFKRKSWTKGILHFKLLTLSCVAFMIPMLPMLFYDLSHGFPQTIKFIIWIGYRIMVFFGYPPINPITPVFFNDMVNFFVEFFQRLLFPYNASIALLLIFTSLLYSLVRLTKKKFETNIFLIFLITIMLIIGISITKTTSYAYLPMLFPTILLITTVFLDSTLSNKKFKYITVISLLLLIVFNIYFLIANRYSFVENTSTLPQKLAIAKYIVKDSGGKEYNLIGVLNGKQHENYSKHYEYLTWWLGHGPSKSKESLRFTIIDEGGVVKTVKENVNIRTNN